MSSEAMLTVVDGDDGDLATWITAETELRGSVRRVSEAMPSETLGAGPAAQLTVSLASGGAATTLARTLIAWLQRRAGSVTVRVSRSDGSTIELSARRVREMDATAIRAQVDQLASMVSPASGVGVGPDATSQIIGVGTGPVTIAGHDAYIAALDTHLYYHEAPASAHTPQSATSHGGRKSADPAAGGASGSAVSGKAGENAGATFPVTIYLSEESIHGQVETAVEELLASAGLRIEDRDEPVIGSWFRRMWASAKEILRSPAGHEAVGVATHMADTRLVLAQDAAVTATLLQNLAPVIASLQPTQDAQLRVGALLIVKVNWVVNVFQLTAAQQAKLDHQPHLALSPREVIAALDLNPPPRNGDGPPALP